MDISKFIRTWMKRLTFRGLSVQQRLPLLICVLLLSIIITFGLISYISIRNASLKTGKERLQTLTDQLSSMFSQSAQATIATTRSTAGQEVFKKYLQTGDTVIGVQAGDALRKLRLDSTWVLAELVDMKHQPVLRSTDKPALSSIKFDSLLSSFTLNNSGSIGKIYLLKDSMYYPIIVPIQDNQQVIGHLVRWRLVTTTPQALERFSQLLGTKARLYVGNVDGNFWTDLIKPVSYQRLDTSQLKGSFEYSDKEGKRVIASARPIAGTSWLVSVEFPRQIVLETSSRFLQWVIIIGSILIIIGIFIGWRMSRNITRPLNKLTAAASAIAGGNYSSTVEVDRRDEVGKLARAFNAMIEQVSKAQDGLEKKIVETAEMNEQLRGLSAYLQNVREDERIHIAREMHDELGQLLTGFKMDVSWLRNKLIESENPAITQKLDYMLGVVDEAVKFVRKLATELRPSILDDLGLIPALEWHSLEFEKRYTIKVEFRSLLQELNMSSMMATGLFRMCQESLTNVARHSNATRVEIILSKTNDEISLSITDNGKGFDTSLASKKTLGLLGMKERASMLGGKMEIISEPGKGTTVSITVKLPVTEKAEVS